MIFHFCHFCTVLEPFSSCFSLRELMSYWNKFCGLSCSLTKFTLFRLCIHSLYSWTLSKMGIFVYLKTCLNFIFILILNSILFLDLNLDYIWYFLPTHHLILNFYYFVFYFIIITMIIIIIIIIIIYFFFISLYFLSHLSSLFPLTPLFSLFPYLFPIPKTTHHSLQPQHPLYFLFLFFFSYPFCFQFCSPIFFFFLFLPFFIHPLVHTPTDSIFFPYFLFLHFLFFLHTLPHIPLIFSSFHLFFFFIFLFSIFLFSVQPISIPITS